MSLLLAMAVFAILGHAIFTLTTSSFSLIGFTRARIAARHLAQEKIELIRNLAFDDVGTQGGIPVGPLVQSESIERNGLVYSVKTSIVYVDDPFDGVTPADLLPTDYKRVRIDVSWQGQASSSKNPVVLVSDIAPKGIETTAGGGTLSILVFDANALPVAQADIHIEATEVNPPVDLDLQTSDTGYVVLPGAPECISCYDISVTKAGFSTDRTYTTAEVANPSKPPISIIEGELTEISFAIDKLSTLNLASVSDRESGFNPLGNITFQLRGDKITGTDSDDFPVYKIDKQFTTDAGGNIIITNVEWDNYTLIMPGASGWDISGTNPLVPLQLLPDTSVGWKFALANQTPHRLLISFTDSSQTPIASVSATLSFGNYQETKLSGASSDPDFGQAFFFDLQDKNHDLEATASGYQNVNTKVKVDGYTEEDFILQPE